MTERQQEANKPRLETETAKYQSRKRWPQAVELSFTAAAAASIERRDHTQQQSKRGQPTVWF